MANIAANDECAKPHLSNRRWVFARVESTLRNNGLWNRRQLRDPDASISVEGQFDGLWRPEKLAVELGVPAKSLRRWARAEGWRVADEKARAWSFTSEQARVLHQLAGR
ncbi:hypothetical protein L1277_000411 [Okibacterium sp. HSC-33S16]|uniref:hypothetical protein n=1 Tax=Okibacterium sp. HSC-33S16 TaxID=2910965 RepID=UPI00209E5472|nr:hypothetical protein [Okibacterium sp. HSC-33S16]MCP2030347.1 hypothetical protein [Okibacterium sp. HSC-33S16]